jgi:hypothetical protein
LDASADASAMLAYVVPGKPQTVRDVIRRNGLQDASLTPEGILRRIFGLYFAPRILGSETYLRIRDFIYSQFPEQ